MNLIYVSIRVTENNSMSPVPVISVNYLQRITMYFQFYNVPKFSFDLEIQQGSLPHDLPCDCTKFHNPVYKV